MELEDMKALWDEMSEALDKQKKLTDKLILDMTQERYSNKLRNIWIPELIGSVICFAFFGLIIAHFGKLNTWYLQVCGLLSAAFYLILPLMSLRAIHRLRSIDLSRNTYRDTIIAFAKARKQFVFVQKLGFYLCFLILLTSLPIAGVILDGKDILAGSHVWFWYVPLGFLFLYFFARWVYKHYMRTTDTAGAMLSDLEP